MIRSQKINFPNGRGHDLAAVLEWPVQTRPHAFALFAHCFTCGKDLRAARTLARALTQAGIAVLRFDFTGLGQSGGDFSRTDFSSNVEDLLAAAAFLEEEYEAPTLLVGHSLGGAAVVLAAAALPQVRAVATLGAPADAAHVQRLFADHLETIEEEGVATVKIAGRPFSIRRELLADLEAARVTGTIGKLRHCAWLFAHAPQDKQVNIENAALLYQAAFHPKSFLSLDGADHLLTDAADATYFGEVLAKWATRYLELPQRRTLSRRSHVAVRTSGNSFTTDINADGHVLTADEPGKVGGDDFGPDPYELLAASLGACTAMTISMYARRKQWPLAEVEVHLEHDKRHAVDCEQCEDAQSKIDVFDREIVLRGSLDEQQRAKLLEIADKCPVHRTLHGEVQVKTRLAEG